MPLGLEQNCQLSFGSATPLLAEVVSFKLASQPAREVEQDLAKCQGLTLSDTYLRTLGEQVGQLAVEKVGGGVALRIPPGDSGGDHRHGGRWHHDAGGRRGVQRSQVQHDCSV